MALYNPLDSKMEYEVLLHQHLNREFSQNKLHVRKNLIAQAVGRGKPKKARQFAGDIIKML